MSWASELVRGNIPRPLSSIVDTVGQGASIFRSNIQPIWTGSVETANPGLGVQPNYIGTPSQLTSGSVVNTPPKDNTMLIAVAVLAVLLLVKG